MKKAVTATTVKNSRRRNSSKKKEQFFELKKFMYDDVLTTKIPMLGSPVKHM